MRDSGFDEGDSNEDAENCPDSGKILVEERQKLLMD